MMRAESRDGRSAARFAIPNEAKPSWRDLHLLTTPQKWVPLLATQGRGIDIPGCATGSLPFPTKHPTINMPQARSTTQVCIGISGWRYAGATEQAAQ